MRSQHIVSESKHQNLKTALDRHLSCKDQPSSEGDRRSQSANFLLLRKLPRFDVTSAFCQVRSHHLSFFSSKPKEQLVQLIAGFRFPMRKGRRPLNLEEDRFTKSNFWQCSGRAGIYFVAHNSKEELVSRR